MFRDLDAEFLEEVYEKQVRFIAAELPLGFLEAVHPKVRDMLEKPMLAMASQAAKKKVDFDIDLQWTKVRYATTTFCTTAAVTATTTSNSAVVTNASVAETPAATDANL